MTNSNFIFSITFFIVSLSKILDLSIEIWQAALLWGAILTLIYMTGIFSFKLSFKTLDSIDLENINDIIKKFQIENSDLILGNRFYNYKNTLKNGMPIHIFFSYFTSMGLIQPCSHALSVMYFSTDPMVTVPWPDCSITQLPSQRRS